MSWKILYVDDEDDIREIALMALGLEPDFEARDCASGAEALDLVKQWAPDLILLDVMMPGMDGPTTLARLQQMDGAALPIVLFCTARAQPSDIQAFHGLGAQGVISKPFDPMALAEIVRSHLR